MKTRPSVHWLIDPHIIGNSRPCILIISGRIVTQDVNRAVLRCTCQHDDYNGFSRGNARRTSNKSPVRLEPPGLRKTLACVIYALVNPPSIKPDSPRLTTVRSKRPGRRLERPEEQGVVRMTRSLNGDIAGPIPSKRPCHVWKAPRHLKVCENVMV